MDLIDQPRRAARHPGHSATRRLVGTAVLLALILSLAGGSLGAPGMALAQEDIPTVGLYQKFELTLDWTTGYDNPFDPAQVSVEATFTAPDGDVLVMPGFVYQAFTRSVEGRYEEFEPAGDPVWMVRFAPQQLGTYTYAASVTDANGTTDLTSGSFEAVESDEKPFIHLGPIGQRTFEYETGEPFVPIGINENSTWTSNDDYGLDVYYDRLPQFAVNGINMIRLQMTPNDGALTWSPGRFEYGVWRHYQGLNGYNLASAWKFDQLMNLVHDEHMTAIVNIEQALALGSFAGTESQAWVSSPYNVANGGMLEQPLDFFSNEEAKSYFKNQLRYIIARWGYSSSMFAWELFNEFDWLLREPDTTDAVLESTVDWHTEMAEYLKEIDPYDHLVTTNVATPIRFWPEDSWYFELWQIPDMDICNFHLYNLPLFTNDTVKNLVDYLNAFYAETTSPCLIGEWGIDSNGDTDALDVAGIGLHNALWTATMMKAALLPHYFDLVHDYDQYGHFRALSTYLGSEPEGLTPYALGTVSVSDVQLETLGLTQDDRALVWIHNKQSFDDQTEPAIVQGATLSISGLVPGQYWIELWNPYDGTITDVQTTIHTSEPMLIALPPIERDIALKVWVQ
ncbi:DUF5060 domain-containing protein [Aggregatilinea lenta]|uniref:DUF5060 domain-containing protein n=1 Tax=Aggregatilinea lenta TaxID=913108 RepID=UPI0013C34B77|nr:DUF5060 domain-containing protein [Aggregatilinea lenta]